MTKRRAHVVLREVMRCRANALCTCLLVVGVGSDESVTAVISHARACRYPRWGIHPTSRADLTLLCVIRRGELRAAVAS